METTEKKTIKDVVDESIAIAKKLMSENPALNSMGFEFEDFTLDEMKAAAIEYQCTEPEFRSTFGRFSLCHSPLTGVYIHLRSVKVKAKLVYDEA